MLQKLYIKNFAIIESLNIDFTNGLIALTGETGAGKSILLGSIQLLLGGRADSNSLLDKTEKCIVEAEFEIDENTSAIQLLQQNDLEFNSPLIIRREILTTGRSRAFVNDSPVNVAFLNELGVLLIDLHRQFDTLEIKDNIEQLQIIDTLANNVVLLSAYQEAHQEWILLRKKLQQLITQKQAIQQEYDYNLFQYNEIETMSFKPDELENIEEELKVLSNAEDLKQAMESSLYALSDQEEQPILTQLKQVLNTLNAQSHNFKKLEPLVTQLNSAFIDIKDIYDTLSELKDEVVFDDDKLNLLLDRLNEGNRLLKKHGFQSTNQLIELRAELSNKLEIAVNIDESIATLEQDVNVALQKVQELAGTLSKIRKSEAQKTETAVNKLLPKVGMPAARLKIEVKEIALQQNGADAVQFMLDANNINKFSPIGKAASGGELSRLILCIKSLMAAVKHLPTLIFDEIDTGISGETAKQVGTLMQAIATKHQVVVVTHLPQIAAKANCHLYVYKQANDSGKITTQIKYLDTQERVAQIAQMLSGDKPSATAMQAAKELLNIEV